jgi:uncharacterized protein (TIGR02271 family)
MAKGLSFTNQRAFAFRNIIPEIIVGGLIGIFVGFFYRTNILFNPGLSTVFSVIPINEIISGALLGIAIGGIVGGIYSIYLKRAINSEDIPKVSNLNEGINSNGENITLEIKKEQLEVAKKWVQTGQVKIYKETIMEEKSYTVPVMHEELVIEKKILSSASSNPKDEPMETIRIILNKEEVAFTKHRVELEDVSIYKKQIEEIKHIEEKLKREEIKVKISGSSDAGDKSRT